MKQLRYVEHLAIQQAYDIRRREFLPPFGAMFGLALSLHLLLLLAWSLFPKAQPNLVPLQAITVRLGGGGSEEKRSPAEVALPRPHASEDARSPSETSMRPARIDAPARHQLPPPTVSPGARVAKAAQAPPGQGSRDGTPDGLRRVTVERYTRQLSLQVQTYARGVRMTEEFRQRVQGRRVAVELLLVIGQNGELSRISVAQSSGFAELDAAAVRAARTASPYPPPPAEYSGFGFKVAVFVD